MTRRNLNLIDALFFALTVLYFFTLLGLSDHCLWSDEAWLGGVVQNFRAGEGFVHNGEPPVELRYVYFLLALTSRSFISDPEFSLIFPSTLSSVVLLVSFYFLLSLRVSKITSLLVVIILACNPLTIFLAKWALPDMPYVGLAILSLYCFVKYLKTCNDKFYYIFALLVGINIFIKTQSLFLLPAVPIFLLLTERKEAFFKKQNYIVAVIISLSLISFLIINYVNHGNLFGAESMVKMLRTGESNSGQSSFNFYYLGLDRILMPTMTIAFIVLLPFAFIKDKMLTLLCVIGLISTGLLCSYWPIKVIRYGYIFIPLAYAIIAIGLEGVVELTCRLTNVKDVAPRLLAILIFLPIAYSGYAEGKGIIDAKKNDGCGFAEAGNALKAVQIPGTKKIFAARYRALGYYAKMDVYPFPRDLDSLLRKIESGEVMYMVFDRWTKTQPNWLIEELKSGKYPLFYPQVATPDVMVYIFRNPKAFAEPVDQSRQRGN